MPAEVVVNATPIGMGGDPALPVEPASDQWVVDLVYHPLETPLLRRARAVGAPTVGGLGMLVHQAALAFEQWTGVPAPLDAMRAARRRPPPERPGRRRSGSTSGRDSGSHVRAPPLSPPERPGGRPP